MKYYTGVGSRETPPEIIASMSSIAMTLAARDYCLRSGGAPGADTAFEQGVPPSGAKEIFLPWRGFNGHPSPLFTPSAEALAIAATIHPAWHRCSLGAQKLHARNVHQILGPKLDSPSEFVVCWTKGGVTVGGTATVIRLALQHKIPVYNLGHPDEYEEFWRFVV